MLSKRDENLRSNKGNSEAPFFFEWTYKGLLNGLLKSGLRQWYRHDDLWEEVYPSGYSQVFSDVSFKKINIDGIGEIEGSIVTKPEKFQIFIPHVSRPNFNNLGRYPENKWYIWGKYPGQEEWFRLGVMNKIESEEVNTVGNNQSKRKSIHTRNVEHSGVGKFTDTVLNGVFGGLVGFGVGAVSAVTHPAIADQTGNHGRNQKIEEQNVKRQASMQKRMLQQKEREAQQQQGGTQQNKPQMKEQMQQEKEERKAKARDTNEMMHEFRLFLDGYELSTYKGSYEDFAKAIPEVGNYALSDGAKKRLYEDIQTPKKAFFDKKNASPKDAETEADKFTRLLMKYKALTKEKYEAFKKTDAYKSNPLSDLDKDMLFEVLYSGNELDKAAEELDTFSVVGDNSDVGDKDDDNVFATFKV